jgi:DNA primase
MDSTNKWYQYLYKERKLSPAVIQRAGLKETNGWLEIPVRDNVGEYLFSKYRKPPWVESNLPKYTYDKGSKASLYGVQRLISARDVYVTEGELDVLTLRTCGEEAVSSTGGAMTFKEEWAKQLGGKDVTLLFDNDETGISGAVRVAMMLDISTFRWVPPVCGKDISDVLSKYGMKKVHEILNDERYCVRIHKPYLSTQATIKKFRKELVARARKTPRSVGTQFLNEIVVQLTSQLSQTTKRRSPNYTQDDSQKERAKTYPIENLLEVNQRKASCPFHKEKTASFHVYKDNTGYCFGCNQYADPIDIVMVKFNLNFMAAVKYLNDQ